MYDLTTLKLMHFHGDQEVPLQETADTHHDAADHDVERGWWRRTYKCSKCDEIVIAQGPVTTQPK